MTIICPKCKEICRGTKHHCLPKRHYRRQKNTPILLLCRRCHDKLELMIPFNKQPKEFYYEVINTFLEGGDRA
jgi:hypothetical protein